MSTALTELLEDIKSIEPLPQVATRVMQLAAQPDVVPSDLIAVIQSDPGTTAKVLKLCNSSLYGFQREISSLEEAGNRLGVQTLSSLALTSCAGRYLRDYGYADPEAALALWERSIATAVAAATIAERSARVERHRAYTLGLLENIGQIVLLRFVPEHREQIAAAISSGVDPVDAERAAYGLSHAEVGARLARKWSFPEELVEAIRTHHDPRRSHGDLAFASVGHLAEAATHRFHVGDRPGETVPYDVQESAFTWLELPHDSLDTLAHLLRVEIAKARAIFEIA
jgi:HD-like signal output (HDOD) protein